MISAVPKFSIIVPTRNRARTLRHTLKTCLDQTFESFEVVVSDNFSDDETQELLASITDPRLRHVRTSSYISMSRNFQNALQHARGENLIVIGDDDGILQLGLELLNHVLEANPQVDAVRWWPVNFWWPHKREYYFRFARSEFGHERSIERAEDIMPRITHPQILNFFEMTGFTLYHGCWRRSVADRALADGVDLFDGPIPDVLSSIYGLHYARACLRLEAPVTIMGVSGKSNGWATSATQPTDEQRIMRADFAERSRRDYPDSPPVTFSFCACSPYLGSLLTYWLGLHGDLADFDHEAWREIFLNQLVFLYAGAPDLLRDYAAHVAWLRQHGAVNARGISADDVEAYRKSGTRLPDLPLGKPPPTPSLFHVLFARAQGKVRRVPVRLEGNAYVGWASTSGEEFTVKDFADLYLAALGISRKGNAVAIAQDASCWARVAISGLERQRIAESWWGKFLTLPVVGAFRRS